MTERIGPYELLTRLGAGGMGEVFLARLEREQGFEKHLALKRILPTLSGSPRFQDLFAAEARLTAGLNHPNIVQVVDFGSQAGACYLVMEYVDGADLAALLLTATRAGRSFPPDATLSIGLACAQALSHAHGLARPVIHGDMCPANVLIGRAGEIKLTDFGLARLAAEPNRQAAGHPGCMAPEVAAGGPLDALADQFGLGASLLHLATGQPAYPPRADPAEALEVARRGQVRKAAALDPDIHPGLAAILDRALAVDPGRRFPSLEELEDALERLRLGLGLAVGPRPVARLAADLLPSQAPPSTSAPRGGTLVASPSRPGPRKRSGMGRGAWLLLGAVALAGSSLAAWWWTIGPGGTPRAVLPPAGIQARPEAPGPTSDGLALDMQRALDDPPGGPQPVPGLPPDPGVDPASKARVPTQPTHSPPGPNPVRPGVPAPEPGTPDPVEEAWIRAPDLQAWTIDGRKAGSARQVLTPGGHLVRLASADGLTARVRIEIPASPGPASLSVQAEPFAILHLDGRPRGTTPIAGLSLAPGDHSIALVNAGKTQSRLELLLHVP